MIRAIEVFVETIEELLYPRNQINLD